ncbi:hypothetical protein KY290_034176 [Solanum tuberosum]|uniref:Uncharacterized protein n=1 Tax=Solanum tuberosum TaxID=4113 RepID=A0ABQ7U2Z8_SOLTU|nr:hypothetical protein KY289_033568 [Solanum tuberosum]KAH0741133.1 hypothetical protein KY290_034176 [Solanum tuberosum]
MTIDLPSVLSSKDCTAERSTEVVSFLMLCKWSKNLSVVMNMTVDLPSVSSSFNDEKGVVNAMDPEANDRMQPLLESVLEDYFTSLLHEEACVIINVAEDLNILNGVASQNDSSDAILVSENLAFVDIQTTSLCKKSVHQKSITYVIPMSDQFSSAFQKSADLDAMINEMTDELQPPEYFVLLGCVPNP